MKMLIHLVPLIGIIPLLLFWAWMFSDMVSNNTILSNSNGSLNWPPASKFDWTVLFIFLNVFAAILYYFAEYKPRH